MFWAGISQGHPFYPLRQQFYLLLQLYSSGLVKFGGMTALVVSIFLLLTGLFLTRRQNHPADYEPRQRLLLANWLLLPPLAIYLISLRVPVFEDRYVIYITPAFYLLIALGLILIRRHSRWLAGFGLGLLLAFNLAGIWQQQRQPIKADFRAAAAYLASQPTLPQTIIIQIPYLKRTFDYYYPQPYKFLDGLWTNGGKTPAEVNRDMLGLTAGLADVWLVVSEEEAWDSRQLMRSWLAEHGYVVNQARFMRVEVLHYQLTPGGIESPAVGN